MNEWIIYNDTFYYLHITSSHHHIPLPPNMLHCICPLFHLLCFVPYFLQSKIEVDSSSVGGVGGADLFIFRLFLSSSATLRLTSFMRPVALLELALSCTTGDLPPSPPLPCLTTYPSSLTLPPPPPLSITHTSKYYLCSFTLYLFTLSISMHTSILTFFNRSTNVLLPFVVLFPRNAFKWLAVNVRFGSFSCKSLRVKA